MATYKVGDRVKVRDDLVEDSTYDGLCFCADMVSMKGKWVTIKIVDNYDNTYRINEDVGYWWNDAMFEEKNCDVENFMSFTSSIVRWLGEHYLDGTYTEVFGCECSLDVLVKMFAPNEIIQRIQDYEKGIERAI